MNRLDCIRVGVAALMSAALLAITTTVRAEEAEFIEPVVPPGQEGLLSAMLGKGAALPDGCKWDGGGADGPIIHARYKCQSGNVVFELVHPDNARKDGVETEDFSISVEEGSPPEELADALASLVRSRETEFEWVWLTEDDEATDGDDSPPE